MEGHYAPFGYGQNLMRKISKLTMVELAVLLIVAGVIINSLILSTVTYHFQKLSMNFYENGTVDFSADVTRLVRPLGLVSLLCMFLGLVIGIAMGLGDLHGQGKVKDLMPEGGPQSERYADALLRSGLIRIAPAGGRIKYEITQTGIQFLKDHREIERILELAQKPRIEA